MLSRQQLLYNLNYIYNWEKQVDNKGKMEKSSKYMILPPIKSKIWQFIIEVSNLIEYMENNEPDVYTSFSNQLSDVIWPLQNPLIYLKREDSKLRFSNIYTPVLYPMDPAIELLERYDLSLKRVLSIYTWAYILGYMLNNNGNIPLKILYGNHVADSFRETIELLNMDSSTIEIYRGICVKDAYKDNTELSNSLRGNDQELWDVINILNYSKIGVYWAYNQMGVLYFLKNGGQFIEDCYEDSLVVILRSTVHSSDIEWTYSALLKQYFPGESEVRLKQGVTIRLEAIKEAHDDDSKWRECPGQADCLLQT